MSEKTLPRIIKLIYHIKPGSIVTDNVGTICTINDTPYGLVCLEAITFDVHPGKQFVLETLYRQGDMSASAEESLPDNLVMCSENPIPQRFGLDRGIGSLHICNDVEYECTMQRFMGKDDRRTVCIYSKIDA